MTAPTLPRETLTCKGSNHVPGCKHHPETLPPVFALVDVAHIAVGSNVRHEPGDLEELAASIREHGVLQPIEVVPNTVPGPAPELYVLVYGQRRLAAAKLAGLTRIPAIVKPDPTVGAPGAKRSIEQLVENLHRADLNPVDRARAMREVVDAGMTQADLARELGLHNSTIANDLGILDAPPAILEHVAAGRLTASHAKAMKGLAASTQKEFAARAIANGTSAHGLEEDVQRHKRGEQWRKKREAEERDRAKAHRAAQEASIAKLAKRAPKDAPIHVGGGYYGHGQEGHVGELIRKAGFTKVVVSQKTLDPKPKGVPCDCTAWKVEIGYSGNLSVAPACVKPAHQEARDKAEHEAREATHALQGTVQGRVQGLVTEAVLAMPPEVARVLLWTSLDWSLNDWVRDHKGDRKKPDAWDEISALPRGELAVEVSRYVAKAFNDRYGIKLDWPRIAAELGVAEEPKPEPAAKPKRRAKAEASA